MIIHDSDLKDGVVDEYISEELDKNPLDPFICSYTDIIKLPFWDYVETVYCSHCLYLTHLPNWTYVKEVFCHECPLLTRLPDWAYVKLVFCFSCQGLERLGNWPNVMSVRCYDCPMISEFPLMPKIKSLQCTGSGIFDTLGITNASEYHKELNKLKHEYTKICLKNGFNSYKLQVDKQMINLLDKFIGPGL
jgi:hypothetical protein